MRFLIIHILILVLLARPVFSFGQGIESYIEKYQGLACDMMNLYNIPASVTLSIAIVESGAGTSKLASKFHNHFGITGKNYDAIKKLGSRSRYKEYESDTESYNHFCQVITHKRFYQALINNPDYKVWISAIGRSGYANAANHWRKKVLSTINRHQLQKLDVIEKDPLNKGP